MLRRLAVVICLVGCNSPTDPCGGQSATCVALTVNAPSGSGRVDTLRIYGFGELKLSMLAAGAVFPVGVGLVPPAGVNGPQTIAVEGIGGGNVIGIGSTTVTITDGAHSSATVTLATEALGTCPSGFKDCMNASDGCETFIAGDPQNCGDCGTICSYPNGTPACVNSACGGSCNSPYADCDNKPANGCEVDLDTDPANCGACTTPCGLAEICSSRRCVSNVVNCLSPGASCPQSGCSSNRFAVSSTLAIDTANARRLWQRASTADTWDNATAACTALSLDGITTWRLPTYAELSLLLQSPGGAAGMCPTCNPAIDQAAFPGTAQNDKEWTSDVDPSNSSARLIVDFCSGLSGQSANTSTTVSYRCTHDAVN
jgi:hypothetical protein